MNQRYTAIDLFAGCGGCTVGLKRAGFDVIGAVEIDEAANATYKLNHPEVPLWECDISTLTPRRIRRDASIRRGELHLLAGCPPCQGFSTVRTLNGGRSIRDDRNDLIYEFQRLVGQLRPWAVMLENVPGLGSDTRADDFVDSLRSAGYSVSTGVLDAADYGVPQRRRRYIILAGRGGAIAFPRRVRRWRTVRDAIGSIKPHGESGDPIHDAPQRRSDRIQDLISMVPKDGGSRLDLPEHLQLPCHRRCDGFKDIYGRMAWDSVAPTLTTGCFNPSRGRFLHPEEDRAITMREAAILQTFPRRYRFAPWIGKQQLASLIGNAIPPELVRRLARSVSRFLSEVQCPTI